MRKSYKILALLLSVLMIVGIAAISPVTVLAAEDDSEAVGVEYVSMRVGEYHSFKATAPMNGAITSSSWSVNSPYYLEQISSSNTSPSITYKALKATTSSIIVTCRFSYRVGGSTLLNQGSVSFYVSISGSSSGGSSGGSGGSGGSSSSSYITVYFDANGGSVSPKSMTYKDGIINDLPVPTRSGYDFKGWTNSSGSVYYVYDKIYSNGVTLYAKWSKKVVTKPAQPTITSLSYSGNRITADWPYVDNATKYQVARTMTGQSGYTYFTATTSEFTEKNVKAGTLYTYQVRAYNDNVAGSWSVGKTISTAKPTLTVCNKNNGMYAQWNKIGSATGYVLYYRKASASSWSSVTTTNNYYQFDSLTAGTMYYFQVAPKFGDGKGAYSNVVSCTHVRNTTLKSTAYNSNGSVTVGWDAAPGANGYAVAKKKSTDKSYTYYYTSSTTFNDKNVVGGALYYYQIRPYYTNGKSAAYSDWSNSKTVTTLFKPTITNMNISASNLNINWNSIKGAKGFKVAFKRSTDSAWNYRTTTLRYYNVPNPTKGATYQVQVCATSGNFASLWSDLKTITLVVLTKPTLNGDANGTKNNLSWNSVNGAKSYQIAKKTTEQTAYTYLTTSATFYYDYSFTDGQIYTYQVRAYNGSEYGPWSNVLTLKTPVDVPVISEFEDYGIALIANWNDVEGAGAYMVSYRQTGKTEWTNDIVLESEYIFPDYAYNSKYYFKVRAIGENGVYSDWSKEKNAYTMAQ